MEAISYYSWMNKYNQGLPIYGKKNDFQSWYNYFKNNNKILNVMGILALFISWKCGADD